MSAFARKLGVGDDGRFSVSDVLRAVTVAEPCPVGSWPIAKFETPLKLANSELSVAYTRPTGASCVFPFPRGAVRR